nr:BA14K family protein [uncultured Shinella sp.]
MRAIAALAAGVLLSLATFVAGVLGTVVYLSDMQAPNAQKSSDVSDLWTSKPVLVATDNPRLIRVSARSPQKDDQAEQLYTPDGGETPDVDMVETGSTPDIEQVALTDLAPHNPQHMEWCALRYNSYRAQDDTYQPYQGKRRRCTSPYQTVADDGIAAFAASAQDVADSQRLEGEVGDALTMQTAYLVDEVHAQRCSTRYRSYRFEDNTYQPLSGGPRRQCR